MFFFCIGFYSSIDPIKGRGLDVKKHAIAYLLPSKFFFYLILSSLLSLSLSLSLSLFEYEYAYVCIDT